MAGLALVDYDNLCGPRERTGRDRRDLTARLVEQIVDGFHRRYREMTDLELRFYGGWTDEEGRNSPAAREVAALLLGLPRKMAGVFLEPRMATSLLAFPEVVLQGTVRLGVRPARQKMVDEMLGGDAVFAAWSGVERVSVVTDDEDLLPAILTALAIGSSRPFWLRRRVPGAGPNDAALIERGIRIERRRRRVP